MNIFDFIKVYEKEWEESNSRKFSDEEIARITKAIVVMGAHGKAVRFYSDRGSQYISLEPSSASEVSVGDELDMKSLIFVELKYVGDKPEQQVKKCYKIRLDNVTPPEVTFDNPFGL